MALNQSGLQGLKGDGEVSGKGKAKVGSRIGIDTGRKINSKDQDASCDRRSFKSRAQASTKGRINKQIYALNVAGSIGKIKYLYPSTPTAQFGCRHAAPLSLVT